MKTLYESLLDDFDELDKDFYQNAKNNAKKGIKAFLIDNYKLNSRIINPRSTNIKISNKPNKDGKYVVDIKGGLMIINRDIYTLTNDLFVFGKVSGGFYCEECNNLTSLEGAPENVGMSFYCANCENLTSLKGAPKEVGMSFYCEECNNLTSLEGAPEKVGRDFYCTGCIKLKNLDHLPENVRGSIYVPDHLKNN